MLDDTNQPTPPKPPANTLRAESAIPETLSFTRFLAEDTYDAMPVADLVGTAYAMNPFGGNLEKVRQGDFIPRYAYDVNDPSLPGFFPTAQQKTHLAPLQYQDVYGYMPQSDQGPQGLKPVLPSECPQEYYKQALQKCFQQVQQGHPQQIQQGFRGYDSQAYFPRLPPQPQSVVPKEKRFIPFHPQFNDQQDYVKQNPQSYGQQALQKGIQPGLQRMQLKSGGKHTVQTQPRAALHNQLLAQPVHLRPLYSAQEELNKKRQEYAKNQTFSGYDLQTGKFLYSPAKNQGRGPAQFDPAKMGTIPEADEPTYDLQAELDNFLNGPTIPYDPNVSPMRVFQGMPGHKVDVPKVAGDPSASNMDFMQESGYLPPFGQGPTTSPNKLGMFHSADTIKEPGTPTPKRKVIWKDVKKPLSKIAKDKQFLQSGMSEEEDTNTSDPGHAQKARKKTPQKRKYNVISEDESSELSSPPSADDDSDSDYGVSKKRKTTRSGMFRQTRVVRRSGRRGRGRG